MRIHTNTTKLQDIRIENNEAEAQKRVIAISQVAKPETDRNEDINEWVELR